MYNRLFHIFRNTPFGRETFLQSMYFCRMMSISPMVYIPEQVKFLMYFDNDVVQVDLDKSYLTSPATARNHADALLESSGLSPAYFHPKNYTASSLPDIPADFDFMCCPRSISDLSSKIGLGYIGPRVRRIIQSARFPILMTSPAFRKWRRIAVFFGGSSNAFNALSLGARIAETTGFPLELYTKISRGHGKKFYKNLIEQNKIGRKAKCMIEKWVFLTRGRFDDNLYEVPPDALVVAGGYGHGLIKELVFGSKMEKIQSVLPNNFLIVGPNYAAEN